MGLLDKNSWFTKFFEGIPVVGYIPSAVHALAGNIDEARRAAAKSTNSALVTAGGVGGFILGGPAGAVGGGAAMGAVGAGIEGAISTTVSDEVKQTMTSLDGTDILVGTALGGLSGAFSGVSSTISREMGYGALNPKGFLIGKALDKTFVGLPQTLYEGGRPQTRAEAKELAEDINAVAARAHEFQPMLLAGNYTTWIKYGSSGWTEKRASGLQVDINMDGSIVVKFANVEVTGWTLNPNQEMKWEDEAGAARDGKPSAANIQFSRDSCTRFGGWIQYPGEGRVDLKGEYEIPTDVENPSYRIGTHHEGGIIFALAPDGVAGMVVSAQDIGTPQSWKNAINVAANATHEGYSDWQLPTPQQYDSIFANLVEAGLGDFQRNEWYWTSASGYGPGWARAMDLKKRMQYQGRHPILSENWRFRVRAVRSF